MTERRRADRVLVERGLFESRTRAQEAITAGLVSADGVPVAKPSDEIRPDADLRAQPAHPWVSRGALKLAHALDAFGISIAGHACLDVGASTGGFSEVLLARGARRIYAVDVGRDQLHPRLRGRPEIVSMEGTDIRTLEALPERVDRVVMDVSFISLNLVLEPALALVTHPARLVALVKPQFEAARSHNKKGIVRDPDVHAAVCREVAGWVAALGWRVDGVIPSPLAGRDGNAEFLLGASHD
jgi:23S rRNA (cytidine1920-2'-O)/16S rRNA (cytidine1409-2'-O)-methyltransferase